MDFEDFLAAHLNEDPEGIPDSTADLSKPAGMIYAAILKRVYTNMSLENMLELPSGTDCSRFAFLQDRTQQQARFEWFRKDDDLVKYPLAQALLSAKAFNNILNSTSGTLNDLTGYGYSFYSFGGSSLPTAADAKFLYSLLTAGQESYGVDSHLLEWRASNHSLYGGYYEMSFSYDDRQIILPEDTSADPAQAVVDPGADLVLTTKPDSADTKVGETIQIGADLKAQTAVHARLKSYRTELEPVVANADSAVNNGDVAWSPRFCFRSRFFKVYVLARSIVTLKGSGAPVYGPTSRLEAVYDAVDDKILWRRWQATELRRLSDPVP
jgi:hypothetical protein